MELRVVPTGITSFIAANTTAGGMISTSASADSTAMLSAVMTALGPIGASYLASFAPAQINNLAGAKMVGAVHTAISAATEDAVASFVAHESV